MARPASTTPLQFQLDLRRRALGWSMRRLSTDAGLSEATVKKIMSGESRHPRHDTLQRLAKALGCTLDDLLATAAPREPPRTLGLAAVMVRGAAQAGVWREAALWDRTGWYPLPTTEDPRFPGVTRTALEVRGPSMDLIYPDPSIVIVVDYLDLDRGPVNGDRVVCRRRDRNGRHEVTIKAYLEDDDGKAWLWPRSRDPRFQTPFALDPSLDPALDPALDPTGGSSEILGPHDPVKEIVVVARVVESIRRE